jgi:DeoR/GlpR family transcriptional regulator of sugar metabolism
MGNPRSTKGFIPEEGTFESSVGLFTIKRIMAERCDKLILLVDHSKFGRRALCKALDISQIGTVITDSRVAKSDLAALEKSSVVVFVAKIESSTGVN